MLTDAYITSICPIKCNWNLHQALPKPWIAFCLLIFVCSIEIESVLSILCLHHVDEHEKLPWKPSFQKTLENIFSNASIKILYFIFNSIQFRILLFVAGWRRYGLGFVGTWIVKRHEYPFVKFHSLSWRLQILTVDEIFWKDRHG